MKRIILNVQLLMVGAATLMLTSCLGDSENSRSSSGEFVYITNLDGMKVAATISNYITSDALESLSEGDCALVDYKVNFEKTQGNAYVPEYFLIDGNNVFRNSTQFMATTSTDPYQNTTGNDVFSRFTVYARSANTYLGDRWLFDVDYKKYEGEETPQLQVFYDPDNQPEGDVERGFVTLDLVLSRAGGISGSENPLPAPMKSVVKFSELRNTLKDMAIEEPEVQNVYILKFKFRYPVALTTSAADDQFREQGYKWQTTPAINSYSLFYDYREELNY